MLAPPEQKSGETPDRALYPPAQRWGVPSVRRARPPVGVQSTAEQLLQTTTVWEWLKTVVLHGQQVWRQSKPYREAKCPNGDRCLQKLEGEIRMGNAHLEASRALDVHEERVGRLHQPLELVLLLLELCRRVKQVDIAREHLQFAGTRLAREATASVHPRSGRRHYQQFCSSG